MHIDLMNSLYALSVPSVLIFYMIFKSIMIFDDL